MAVSFEETKRSAATAGALGGTTTPQGSLFNEQRRNIMEKRTRNWATVVYPESAPDNWKIFLEEQHVPALISPLHDRDINADGTLKKEHYHIMLLFDGVKTREQAAEVFHIIGGVGAEPVKSARAYARYLTHMDNPEKAQYDSNEVITYSGANYNILTSLAADKYSAIGEMIDYCMENSIVSYAELLLFAKNNRQDWFRVLCDNGTVTLVQFLKSRYWEITQYGKTG